MTDLEAYALENRYPEILAIESGALGLKYLLDNDRKGIVISGMRGMTGVGHPSGKGALSGTA